MRKFHVVCRFPYSNAVEVNVDICTTSGRIGKIALKDGVAKMLEQK